MYTDLQNNQFGRLWEGSEELTLETEVHFCGLVANRITTLQYCVIRLCDIEVVEMRLPEVISAAMKAARSTRFTETDLICSEDTPAQPLVAFSLGLEFPAVE